jgi:threonine dehydrogenase-like Zn-dependent dehydrogenase
VLASVTQARASMALVEAPEPGAPGPGEVMARPEAVGLCGSDFHYFTGDLGAVPEAIEHPSEVTKAVIRLDA